MMWFLTIFGISFLTHSDRLRTGLNFTMFLLLLRWVVSNQTLRKCPVDSKSQLFNVIFPIIFGLRPTPFIRHQLKTINDKHVSWSWTIISVWVKLIYISSIIVILKGLRSAVRTDDAGALNTWYASQSLAAINSWESGTREFLSTYDLESLRATC